MVSELRRQQFTEAGGWNPGDPSYGGWGMGGPIHTPPDAGHVDLSMTRYVMEALRHAGVGPDDPAMTRALVYLERSQNPDGGFHFSLVNPETNKAGEAEDGNGRFASYGTSTADGLLALRAAGLDENDPRVAAATRWLVEHHAADRAPGFDRAPFQSWSSGLRFYYAGAISAALPDLDIVLPHQNADGSFRNTNTMVKEDDPLIATAFAVRVLARG
jgi:squalene-hopene/tetraprenyl-beta-curcumene cyclase